MNYVIIVHGRDGERGFAVNTTLSELAEAVRALVAKHGPVTIYFVP